ncbi:IS5/IS1182 family transposase, partial [Streptomyces sp. NPDC056512]
RLVAGNGAASLSFRAADAEPPGDGAAAVPCDGARPCAGFDGERYKKRNTVERAINRLKGFRAVAARYEKRAYIYLGTVTLAALLIWLRT